MKKSEFPITLRFVNRETGEALYPWGVARDSFVRPGEKFLLATHPRKRDAKRRVRSFFKRNKETEWRVEYGEYAGPLDERGLSVAPFDASAIDWKPWPKKKKAAPEIPEGAHPMSEIPPFSPGSELVTVNVNVTTKSRKAIECWWGSSLKWVRHCGGSLNLADALYWESIPEPAAKKPMPDGAVQVGVHCSLNELFAVTGRRLSAKIRIETAPGRTRVVIDGHEYENGDWLFPECDNYWARNSDAEFRAEYDVPEEEA